LNDRHIVAGREKSASARVPPLKGDDMKTFVGIDLGSTTTKAVLLDENSQVIGRGITNSRSNYATAARVASEEAHVDGRFTLFRRALNAGGGQSGELDKFLGALERAFRLEQFLEQLDDLEATCRGQVKGERFANMENGVQEALGEVFRRLREEAVCIYVVGVCVVLSVPKIRFWNNGDEVRRGRAQI
jgi:benzoyl-CoA reductase subunit A